MKVNFIQKIKGNFVNNPDLSFAFFFPCARPAAADCCSAAAAVLPLYGMVLPLKVCTNERVEWKNRMDLHTGLVCNS